MSITIILAIKSKIIAFLKLIAKPFPSLFRASTIISDGKSSSHIMSLFPEEDILTKEIESWIGFADSLNSQEYKEMFNKMLNDCYKYARAINAKGEEKPFPTEPLLMSLLLSQHKMIEWLTSQISKRYNSPLSI